MKFFNSYRPGIKTALILSVQLLYLPALSQSQEYKVLSDDTKTGIGYVNVGIPSRNTGTVTDETGTFTLDFDKLSDDDSLRVSMIGYGSKSVSVGQLRKNTEKTIFLTPRIYKLPELNIIYPRGREIQLGTPVFSNALRSGFADNNLGYELGIKVNIKKRLKLKDIQFNVGVCSFDSVTYRLNVYQLSDQSEWENILTQPIYISFNKNEIGEAITFDLKDYYIYVQGEVIITLEHYRDLGPGRLLFLTQFFTGTTYHRQTKDGEWTLSPGQVGISLHGQSLR